MLKINAKKRLKKEFKIGLIFLVLLLITCYVAYEKTIKKEYIQYNETSNLNYIVCYTQPNELNQGCLPQSINNYVTKYIDNIKPNFLYKLNLNDKVDTTYKYKITGELTIFDRNNHSLIMEKKDYILLKEKEVINKNTDKILINELLDLNYKEYAKYVFDYKSNASVSASANLKVLFHIDSYNRNNKIRKNIKISEDIILNIPLDEQTIQLETNYTPSYLSENIEINNDSPFLNALFIILILVTELVGLLLIIIIAKTIYKNYKKIPLYEKLITSLKNDFNYEISEISTLIDSDAEEKYIYLDAISFKELYDLVKTSIEKKIFWNEKLYFNNKGKLENRISWFFVFLSDEKVMRFVVDENKLNQEYKEDDYILKKYKG